MTNTINDNLEVIGNTETVAKFSRSSSDVSALLESGSGNEVYLRFKNSETGNNSWMAGMDDDEQFKIAYGADGEIRGAETKLYVAQSGNVGIGTTNPQAKLEVQSPWSDWMFLRQQRNVEGGGGFHIHNPWGNSDQSQGDPSRNRLEIAYRTPGGQDLWEQFVLHGPSGNVGIGTANPQAKLHVNGDIKVKDWTLSVPDYVFDQDYELRNLDELRTYVDRHKRLPDMPSAQNVSEEGFNLGEFCMSLLKKIEELSLYVLQQDEIIQGQNERLAKLEGSASMECGGCHV